MRYILHINLDRLLMENVFQTNIPLHQFIWWDLCSLWMRALKTPR